MSKRFHLCRIDIPCDVLRLCLLREYDGNVKVFRHDTGNSDSGCLYRENFINLSVGKAPFEFLANLLEQPDIHLMV